MIHNSKTATFATWLILILAIACIGYVAFKAGGAEVDFTVNLFVLSFSFLVILVCTALLFWNRTRKDHDRLMVSLYVTPYLWLVVITILSVMAVPVLDVKMDGDDVTNFYTAFIALCTTFVVGFQIYNSIELNKKIEDLNARNSELEKKWLERQHALEEESRTQREEFLEEIKTTKRLISKSNYYNAYNLATVRYTLAFADKYMGDKRLCWNSLRSYFYALRYAAEGGHDFEESLETIGNKIKKCISALSNSDAPVSFRRINLSRSQFIREINATADDTLDILVRENRNSKEVAGYKELMNDWHKFLRIFEIAD